MGVHVFGIRHHGPGSARSLVAALDALQPDAILVEGPPDAESVLPLALHDEMQPPVALLIYAPDNPKLGVFYPFAAFSPEWCAIRYGLERDLPVRFMDLPQTHKLALPEDQPDLTTSPPGGEVTRFHADPLGWLAEAAGYNDGERWWDHMVEQRRGDTTGLFAAILEALAALREAAPPLADPAEPLREAYMRKTLRAALKDGYERIAVVCGAWHAPALANLEKYPAKADNTLLKGLPRIKVTATWIPWTYSRLTLASGYGAGIEAPGWYHHLWETHGSSEQIAVGWMTKAARLLRSEDLDASPAQAIDAARLAEALAALRGRPLPGLPEFNDAVRAAMCFGDDAPMQVIWRRLLVGGRIGDVPDETPSVPLQQDLQREMKRLRLKPEPEAREVTLDLRNTANQLDFDRSRLLHRLSLLDIEWGTLLRAGQEVGKGTSKEVWRLEWKPEFAVDLIEASAWGNTIYDAAANYARDAAERAPNLPALTELLRAVLRAALPEVTAYLMACLQEKAALTSDVAHLMDALGPLAWVARYGDVRKTDARVVARVVDGLVARICIGLPGACASLDDDAAAAMFERIAKTQGALTTLQNADHLAAWRSALRALVDRDGLHGLIAGRACRLLHDAGAFASPETARRFNFAVSGEPARAAAWIEGFLRGSGLILIHDHALWEVIDSWLSGLRAETFRAVLPLIRRTFATFTPPERQKIADRVKHGMGLVAQALTFDAERATAALDVVTQVLGLETPNASSRP